MIVHPETLAKIAKTPPAERDSTFWEYLWFVNASISDDDPEAFVIEGDWANCRVEMADLARGLFGDARPAAHLRLVYSAT